MSGTWAVVLAGGAGTRFWPRSRPARPKQCLALDGERTLLQRTVDRLEGLIPPDRVLVLTGAPMADTVREQLPGLPLENLLVEPSGRGTLPALAWAAVEVQRRGGARMAALPSDHRVADEPLFREVLEAALAVADQGRLVLLGAPPTRPETGFGWIVPDRALGVTCGQPVYGVQRFVEKPPRPQAEALMAAGALWNTGMFCWRCDVWLEALAKGLPGTARALARLPGEGIEGIWPELEAISVDHGLLERAEGLVVLPAPFGWADLGSWEAMAEVFPTHPLGHARVRAGLALDGGDHVVDAPGKLVVTLGVERLVIVDTGDVLLVCRREDAQRVGAIPGELARRGLEP